MALNPAHRPPSTSNDGTWIIPRPTGGQGLFPGPPVEERVIILASAMSALGSLFSSASPLKKKRSRPLTDIGNIDLSLVNGDSITTATQEERTRSQINNTLLENFPADELCEGVKSQSQFCWQRRSEKLPSQWLHP